MLGGGGEGVQNHRIYCIMGNKGVSGDKPREDNENNDGVTALKYGSMSQD